MAVTEEPQEVKQLIVLGNGFDLTCGAKSKYSDFYDSRKDNKPFNILINYARKRELTNLNWADVENNLLELLQEIHDYHTRSFRGDILLIKDLLLNLTRKYRAKQKLPDNVNVWEINRNSIPKAYELIKNEVKEFEEELLEYLDTETNTIAYMVNSMKLAVNLVLAEYRDDLLRADEEELPGKKQERNQLIESGNYSADFFSFNYTPVSNRVNSSHIQNIHGTCKDKNAILGIDGHKAVDEMLEFTKTYRLLSHSMIADRVDLSQEFECIKFMGHSLGEADYSYFQAIFDGMNLYSSKTKLFFYFHVYDQVKRNEIIAQNYHAVSKLLKQYGGTFKSNPDHGKNLMHKLILEGRLTVKELDCSFIANT